MNLQFRNPVRLLALSLTLTAVGCSSSAQVRVASNAVPTKSVTPPLTTPPGTIIRLNPNKFSTQCSGFTVVAATQKTDVWCWAACVQMIHNYRGNTMMQEEIAARIHGADDVRAATYNEIIQALVPDLPPQILRDASAALTAAITDTEIKPNTDDYLNARVQRNTVNSDILIDDLLKGEPMIAGLRFLPKPSKKTTKESPKKTPKNSSEETPSTTLTDAQGVTTQIRGHAYVVYGADFKLASTNYVDRVIKFLDPFWKGDKDYAEWLNSVPFKYDLHKVYVLDPLSGQKEEFEAAEFAKRVDFMISATLARKILEKEQLIDPK